jgi:hypothetical protein
MTLHEWCEAFAFIAATSTCLTETTTRTDRLIEEHTK